MRHFRPCAQWFRVTLVEVVGTYQGHGPSFAATTSGRSQGAACVRHTCRLSEGVDVFATPEWIR